VAAEFPQIEAVPATCGDRGRIEGSRRHVKAIARTATLLSVISFSKPNHDTYETTPRYGRQRI
jgi:hypothetical protein